MMMISYIINEQRKEERYKVLVKRDEQKHEHILIYWGENLLSFLSLRREGRTRREHDDERAYTHKTKQNKTNAPLNGGIFELSSNWWSFAFLIGTTNCCARRWTTTGRQTYYVCCSQSVIFLWGSDYQHKTKTVHSKPKREIFR